MTEAQVPQLAQPRSLTPAQLLQVAVEKGAAIEQLERLMELQQKYEAAEARKAFYAALSAFKADPPKLEKNKLVSFDTGRGKTEYRHATLDHVSEEIGRALTKHGLSHRWEVEQKEGKITVSCVLSHVQGYSESVSLEAGADTSGSKNSIQAIGSTVTYLERYTLLAATGMAVGGQDDDGAASRTGDGVLDPGLLADHLASIESAADEAGVKQAFASAYNAANAVNDWNAIRAFTEAKDARRAKVAKPKAP